MNAQAMASEPESHEISEDSSTPPPPPKRRRLEVEVVIPMSTRRWAETSIRADINRLQASHDAMVAMVLKHSGEMHRAIGSLKAQLELMEGRK